MHKINTARSSLSFRDRRLGKHSQVTPENIKDERSRTSVLPPSVASNCERSFTASAALHVARGQGIDFPGAVVKSIAKVVGTSLSGQIGSILNTRQNS